MHEKDKPINFTKREIKIIQLAAQGYTNKEIAKILNFSYYTIKSDFQNIIKKSNARNRINAIYILSLKGYVKLSMLNDTNKKG